MDANKSLTGIKDLTMTGDLTVSGAVYMNANWRFKVVSGNMTLQYNADPVAAPNAWVAVTTWQP